MIDLASLQPGDELPSQTFGPVTRTVLALYAGGSGDHNPIHIDSDFAKAHGHDDVFAHGMLTGAYVSRYLRSFCTQDQIKSWSLRFMAMTPANASVHCTGRVASRDVDEIVLTVETHIDDGAQTVAAQARIALD
jgi:acyl dehydratase